MKILLLAIILLSAQLNATPKIFNNTGLATKLENFAPTCTYYSKIIKDSQHIKSLCDKYQLDLTNTLKLGYELDRTIASGKGSSIKKVVIKKYKTQLFSLEKQQNQILKYILKEKTKARKDADITYHDKLIRKDIIKLDNEDYKFIAENRDVYLNSNNPRYTQMIKDGNIELLSEKERASISKKQATEDFNQKLEECNQLMTRERFQNKKRGRIINGTVSRSSPRGYLLSSKEVLYFVEGETPVQMGDISQPIFLVSTGEKDWLTKISMKLSMSEEMYNEWLRLTPAIPINIHTVRQVSVVHHDSECINLVSSRER